MSRAEAERLLGIAEKLLQSRDLSGTKDFAVLAQETEPLLEGPDQILAVAEVLLSSEKRVAPMTNPNNASLHDWYAILQVTRRSDDLESIKKQYRRLALLLHPDKNKYPLADQAFKLVADAWAVLSDPTKKAHYDNELGPFQKVDLVSSSKLPVRRSQRAATTPTKANKGNTNANSSTSNHHNSDDNNDNNNNRYENDVRARSRDAAASFWTVCPYCYVLYEYPRVYENCCLKCQSCGRAFHGAIIHSMPPTVPGKEAYYCSWGFFPLGFVFGGADGKTSGSGAGFPNWMPPLFGSGHQQQQQSGGGGPQVQPQPQPVAAVPVAKIAVQSRGGGQSGPGTAKRKRGRPRKYPLQM